MLGICREIDFGVAVISSPMWVHSGLGVSNHEGMGRVSSLGHILARLNWHLLN